MPGENLEVDTELLSGSVFEPYLTHMFQVVEETEGEITAIGPLVPQPNAEIDEQVAELEKRTVPLVLNFLTTIAKLPEGDADAVELLASLLESVEDTNIKEANPGFNVTTIP